MSGFQPRHDVDRVWWNGTQVNDIDIASTQLGVRVTAIHGWDDRPDVRDVRELRSGQDGEYADNLYLGGRTITLEGEVYGSSWPNLQARKRALAALFQPSSSEAVLKVPDPSAYGTTMQAFVSAAKPVAYWPLTDTVGALTADEVIGGLDGTIAGNPVFGATGGVWDSSTALDLDGTGDYVERAYNATLNPTTLTIAAWVRRDTDTGATEFIATSSDNTANTGWRLFVTSTDTVQFSVGNAASISGSVSTTTLAAGTWYHVVGVYDGTSTMIYVNGVLEDTDAKSYTVNSTQPLRIGARDGSTSNLFNGKVQHVGLWNSALSADAIMRLYDYDYATYAETGMIGFERATGRVIESIQFGDTLDPGCQVWQVILRASDPRVYSDLATSTDSITTGTAARTVVVDQAGTYETPPTLTVTGPTASAFTITEPSSGLAIPMSGLTLASSETVEVDTAERTITYSSTYEGVRLKRSAPPVALWMLDETSGTTADNIQGTAAYDGTYTGGYTLNAAGFDTGIGAVDLNGTTGRITVPYNAALNPSTFSFEAWVRWDTLSGTDTIATCLGSNKGWRLQYSATGDSLTVTIGTGVGEEPSGLASSLGFTTSTWYHIVIVIAPGLVYGYVNGELIGANPTDAPMSVSTATGLTLGGDGTVGVDGRCAAFALYNTSLVGGSQVADLYAARLNSSESSAYTYLQASTARWANLGTASSTYTLASTGLTTGSKLNVTYRDARV